jgi:hypothetical protein
MKGSKKKKEEMKIVRGVKENEWKANVEGL